MPNSNIKIRDSKGIKKKKKYVLKMQKINKLTNNFYTYTKFLLKLDNLACK